MPEAARATIQVDGRAYAVAAGQSLLQACLELGFHLPYFCWHPALGSVGACRQCAVVQYKDATEEAAGRGRHNALYVWKDTPLGGRAIAGRADRPCRLALSRRRGGRLPTIPGAARRHAPLNARRLLCAHAVGARRTRRNRGCAR
ncbi:MAG: 2Fe-2S iron-sulfur cluster-binding protein [Streptosporangiaceae bacterium]